MGFNSGLKGLMCNLKQRVLITRQTFLKHTVYNFLHLTSTRAFKYVGRKCVKEQDQYLEHNYKSNGGFRSVLRMKFEPGESVKTLEI